MKKHFHLPILASLSSATECQAIWQGFSAKAQEEGIMRPSLLHLPLGWWDIIKPCTPLRTEHDEGQVRKVGYAVTAASLPLESWSEESREMTD